MAWQTISEADIKTQITAPELSAARTAAIDAGQADPLPEAITNAVNMVRGYISGWTANTLGPEGTIPDKLVLTAIDVAVYLLCKRIPKKILLTDQRQRAYDAAISLLKDVARGAFRLEVPATFTQEKIAIVRPSISSPCPPADRAITGGGI